MSWTGPGGFARYPKIDSHLVYRHFRGALLALAKGTPYGVAILTTRHKMDETWYELQMEWAMKPDKYD